MKYPNIIWDFDGTLFNTYPSMTEAVRQALLSFGITESFNEIFADLKISYGTKLTRCYERYGIDMQTLDNKYNEISDQVSLDEAKPFIEIPSLLKRITGSGGCCFVFTHRDKSAADLIEYHGLSGYFEEIVSSKITGIDFKRKPDPDGNLYIIDKYGLDPSCTIAIGDREIDILAASHAGIYSCLFTESGTNALCRADHVIDSFTELDDILVNNVAL